MNAGEVVVRLIADLKDFTAKFAKATGVVKDFGAQAQQGLSQAERATTRARDSLGRFTKEINSGAKASTKALEDLGNKGQESLGKLAEKRDYSASFKGGEKAMGAFESSIRKVTYNTSEALYNWSDKTGERIRGWASSAGSALGAFALKGSVVIGNWALQTAATILGWAKSLLHPFQLVQSAIGKIFNIRNIIVGGVIGVTIAKVTQIGAAAEQTERKFTLAFEGMSEGVRAWSDELGTRLKRSSDDIRDSAADLYLFMKNTGLAEKAAVDLTKQITELGYAMTASGRATSEADAIWSMRAGLMGMERAMRAYNVDIGEAALRNWALKNGIDANTKAWTEQQVILARAGVMFDVLGKDMEKAAEAQRDTAPLLKQVRDAWGDVWKAIYGKWKPAIQGYLATVRDFLIDNVDLIAKWAGKVSDAVVAIIKALKSVVEFLETEYLTGWKKSMEAVTLIVEATVDTVFITLEEGLVALGENLPDWIAKGALAAIRGKLPGQKIAFAIRNQILKNLVESGGKLSAGIVDAIAGTKYLEGFNDVWAKVDPSKDVSATINKRVGARLGQLGTDLSKLMADSRQLAQALSQDVKTETDALAAFYGYAAEGAEKQKSVIRSIVQDIKTETDALNAFYGYAAEGMNQQATDMKQAFEDAGKRDPDLKNLETAAIDTYLKALEEEVRLQGLAVEGEQQKVEYQKILNKLLEQAKVTRLLPEEEERIRTIVYKQPQFEITQYLNGLKREAEVIKLINQGKYQGAELQKILNDLERQGAKIEPEQRKEIEKALREKSQAEFNAELQRTIEMMRQEADLSRMTNKQREMAVVILKAQNDALLLGAKFTGAQKAELEGIVRELQRAKDLTDSTFGEGWSQSIEEMQESLLTTAQIAGQLAVQMRDGIVGSLSDAVFRSEDLGESLKRVLLKMLEFWAQEAMFKPLVTQGMGLATQFVSGLAGGLAGGIGGLFGGGGPSVGMQGMNVGGGMGSAMATQFKAKGGIVYAASGMFTPKGTDTVPAMLTPGEGVLDVDMTNRLRKLLAVPGSSGGDNKMMGRMVSLLEKMATNPRPISVAILDKRETARELLGSLDGEKLVMHHVGRNQ